MMQQKKELFLEQLDKNYKKLRGFNQFAGGGLKRKLQRLLFSPGLYIPYSLAKIRLWKNKNSGKLFWGKAVKLNTADIDGVVLASAGMLPYEPEYRLTKFFIKRLNKDDVFYDIGASYGFYTHLVLEFCREAHAFEPIPKVFAYLKESLVKSENLFLNNVALSDVSGSSFLYILSKQDSTGGSIIVPKRNRVQNNTIRIPVQTITLDDYVKNHTKPTIVKLDVEGAEEMVLAGGEKFFRNSSPLISMEVWPKKSGGEISMWAVEKLRKFGYRSHLINIKGELEPVDGNLSEYITVFENYIFKKEM